MLYLDHSATSLLLKEARRAMQQAMDHLFGNPSALHTPGHLAKNAIEIARSYIATSINAEPHEIIFTSGGSESNNTVINIFRGQTTAISNIEHPSLLEPATEHTNCQLLPVDQIGQLKDLSALPKHTKLLSVMLANNEVGTINDIKYLNLSAKTLNPELKFHTDATQAYGKIPIDVKQLGVDYLTIVSHKIGGPAGIGALYVKNGAPFKPFIVGGHQEKGRRAGTYAIIDIAGFGAAAKYLIDHNTPALYQQKVRPLRNFLAEKILQEIPHAQVNHNLDTSLPNLLNVSFAGAEGESIQLYLDAINQIIVSTGSACASGDGSPSHVLMALYHDAEVAHGSIRFSLSPTTTKQDVLDVVSALKPIIFRLQNISTIKLPN